MFSVKDLGNATLQTIGKNRGSRIRGATCGDRAMMRPGVIHSSFQVLTLMGTPIDVGFGQTNCVWLELILKGLNGKEFLRGGSEFAINILKDAAECVSWG